MHIATHLARRKPFTQIFLTVPIHIVAAGECVVPAAAARPAIAVVDIDIDIDSYAEMREVAQRLVIDRSATLAAAQERASVRE